MGETPPIPCWKYVPTFLWVTTKQIRVLSSRVDSKYYVFLYCTWRCNSTQHQLQHVFIVKSTTSFLNFNPISESRTKQSHTSVGYPSFAACPDNNGRTIAWAPPNVQSSFSSTAIAGWWLTYPSEKIWVRQLGWWNSQYMESHKMHVPNHQPIMNGGCVLQQLSKLWGITLHINLRKQLIFHLRAISELHCDLDHS